MDNFELPKLIFPYGILVHSNNIVINRARICMQQHIFLRLLIIDFVSNIHESPHDEVNGGVFILLIFAYLG
jgi:hypothetical protein